MSDIATAKIHNCPCADKNHGHFYSKDRSLVSQIPFFSKESSIVALIVAVSERIISLDEAIRFLSSILSSNLPTSAATQEEIEAAKKTWQ